MIQYNKKMDKAVQNALENIEENNVDISVAASKETDSLMEEITAQEAYKVVDRTKLFDTNEKQVAYNALKESETHETTMSIQSLCWIILKERTYKHIATKVEEKLDKEVDEGFGLEVNN